VIVGLRVIEVWRKTGGKKICGLEKVLVRKREVSKDLRKVAVVVTAPVFAVIRLLKKVEDESKNEVKKVCRVKRSIKKNVKNKPIPRGLLVDESKRKMKT